MLQLLGLITGISRQCIYEHNTEVHLCIHCYHGRAISISYSQCVFLALVILHAKCISHIILSSMAWLAVPFVTNHLTNETIFREKKVIEYKISDLMFFRPCIIL